MALVKLLNVARDQFARRAEVAALVPLFVVLLFFAFHGFHAIGFDGLDPFGLGKASAERSEQATQRVIAPFYTPSDKVTVVLIDDDYLRARQTGWPLPYAQQGLLLRRLLSANPAALIIDLVYPHRHNPTGMEGSDSEALFRPIAGDTTTPIIFTAMAREFASTETVVSANSPRTDRFLPPDFKFCGANLKSKTTPVDELLDEESIQPGLREQLLHKVPGEHDNWRLGLIRWSGCGNDYPLVLGRNAEAVSPAFAAYHEVCTHHPEWLHCVRDAPQWAEQFVEPLRIRWGAFPPWNQHFSNDDRTCQKTMARDGTVTVWSRLELALREVTIGLFEDLRQSRKTSESLPCPAVTVVPLSLLVNASAQDWRQLLQDRVVLLGANISGIPDVFVSPVHGQLPGVLLHAMAVDNLLQYGTRYPANRHREATELLALALVLAFAYCLPFMLWLIEQPKLRRVLAIFSAGIWLLIIVMCLHLGKWQFAASATLLGLCMDIMRPTMTAMYFLVLTAAALLSGISLLYGWPPGNWLGLVLLLFGFGHTLKPYYRAADRTRLPSPYSLSAALWQRFPWAKAIPHD